MKPYADSNFFTRLYLRLPDSQVALALLAQSEAAIRTPLPVTWLHRMEVSNSFQLHVFAGRAPGQTRVTLEQAVAAEAAFRQQLANPARFRQIPMPPTELEQLFEELSLRHTAKHGFRTYDILHVASALILESDTFWSFDSKAAALAEREGLNTELEIP